ncbi:serine hydrolase [Sphingomonas colocasiae]|uniref:Serine hydrolase n=1 Tax=Sphingomonas colocasiae TaxID=1848973 RepID=A0ABS7PNA7_9SPHN|nr:serine hydrolase [Sphingomonas colocasiae]MBY8822788.1 serine hydrolase [Sphingomonas colocasiae]
MRKLAGPLLTMLTFTALPAAAHAQTDAKPAAAPARPPLPANWTLPANAKIAELIDARIAQRPGEGIVVGVLDRSGRRIVARGPGGKAAPFGDRTVLEIGSMSKIFTALLLADMAAKGEVSLDDPAEKYLPAGAKMPERNGRKITLRDLANQHSGLPRLPSNMPFGNLEDPYADYTEEMMLDFLGGYQLTRDIGSQFEYSNLGVGLLGYLLGRADHSDYETMIARRITGPLGMRDTAITLSADQKARFAQGHDAYMRPTGPWSLPTLAGAGALRSTITDMLIFVNAAMNPKSPIAPAMKLATAERWPLGAAGRSIGLGWIIGEPAQGRETLFHNGGTGGFRSAMLLEPGRGSAVVVLTNASVEPSSDDLASHILLGTPLQPLVPVPPAPAPQPAQAARTEVTLPPAELERVIGRYEFAPGVTVVIAREGTGLTAQLTGQPAFQIFAEAPLNFFLRVADAQLRFIAGSDGKVTGMTLVQAGQSQEAKRVAP